MTNPTATQIAVWAQRFATELDNPCYFGGHDDPEELGRIAAVAISRLITLDDTEGLRIVHQADTERLARLDRHDTELAERAAEHERITAQWEEQQRRALTVACPHCGVEPGDRCTTPTGIREPHRARLKAAVPLILSDDTGILGERSAAIVEYVNAHPGGVGLLAVAGVFGMSPNAAGTYLGRLVASGRIAKARRGIYVPVGDR